MESDRSSPSLESPLLAIAQTCFKDGKYEEALKYLKEALDMYKKNESSSKDNQIKRAQILYSFGSVYQEQGNNPDEAIKYFSEYLEEVRRIDPTNQLAIADCVVVIGTKYCNLEKYTEALALFNEALDTYRKSPTLDEWASNGLLVALTNIGLIYHKLKRYEKAISSYKELLEVSAKKSGEILFRIGDCYRMMDKHEEALKYFTQWLDINKHELQSNNCSFAVELHIIGVSYLEEEKYKEALECFNKSMRLYETLPTTNDSIADLHKHIGLAYEGLDMYKEALDNFNTSLNMHRLTLKSDQAVDILFYIGRVYYQQERKEEAFEMFKQSLEICKHESPINYRLACQLLESIGLRYENEENFEEAIKYYTESLEIMRENWPHEIAEIARMLKSIGSAHRKDGNHHEAYKPLHESLEICELLNHDEDQKSQVREEIRLTIIKSLVKYEDPIHYAVKQHKRDSSLFFRLVRNVRKVFRRVRKSSWFLTCFKYR